MLRQNKIKWKEDVDLVAKIQQFIGPVSWWKAIYHLFCSFPLRRITRAPITMAPFTKEDEEEPGSAGELFFH